MSIFDFFRPKGEIALVYDIGNASIGASLSLFVPGEKPKIVYTSRKEIPLSKDVSTEKLIGDLKRAIDTVSLDIVRSGLKHLSFTPFAGKTPTRVHCVLASPWYASQTRKVTHTENKPFILTKKFLTDITNEERKAFLSDPLFSKGTRLIEEQMLRVKLNGYGTEDFYGKEATSIEYSLLLSVVPEKVLDVVKGEIERHVEVPSITFSTFPNAAATVLKHLLHEKDDFLFLDVGGELTDVSLVKDGILLETKTFPLGMRTLIRSLDVRMPGNYEHAKTLMHLFALGTIAEGYKGTIEETLRLCRATWVSSFEEALRSLVRHKGIPSRIYFSADPDVEKFVSSLIAEESFHQFSLCDEPFTPISVNSALLIDHIRILGGSAHDPFLILGALYAHLLYKEKSLE